MPYLPDQRKADLAGGLVPTLTGGDLNYILTQACVECLPVDPDRYTYELLNTIMGALESAKQEFYRRVVVPYENKKRRENGDVYPNVPWREYE